MRIKVSLNAKGITSKIIKKLTAIMKINQVKSEDVLDWTRRREVHRSQKAMLATIQGIKNMT